jgi:aspartate aminotransferase
MTATITNLSLPTSMLEQRLEYARTVLGAYLDYSENVPKWPAGASPDLTLEPVGTAKCYPPTRGLPELIEAVRQRERRRYGLDLNHNQVLVTNGALHALSLVFEITRRLPGVVAYHAPMFRSIAGGLRMAGLRAVPFAVEEGMFSPPANLQRGTPVRLIYVNVPNNPTGATLSSEGMLRLVNYARAAGAKIVFDLVYDDFVARSSDPIHPALVDVPWDDLFIVNSVSKNYGAPDLRIGWLESAADNIAQVAGVLEDRCIAVSQPSQRTAVKLLNTSNAPLLDAVRRGRQTLDELRGRHPTLNFTRSDAGTQYILPVTGLEIQRFADYMLAEHQLLIATSENYVGCVQPHVRLPLAYPDPVLRRASELIAGGLEEWSESSTCS